MRSSWDLSLLFPSFSKEALTLYLQERRARAEEFRRKWIKNKEWKKDPQVLYQALKEYELLNREGLGSNRATFFLSLASSLNQGDHKLLGLLNLAENEAQKIKDLVRFFTLSLAKTPNHLQKTFLRDKNLANWKHFLEYLFKTGKYILSEKEELIISRFNTLSYRNWVQTVSRFLSEEEIKVSWASRPLPFHQVLNVANTERDESKRKEAVAKVSKVFRKWGKMAEVELNSVLRYRQIQDELRGYERPDSSTHLGDDIKTSTVDLVREVVKQNYSIAHRFYDLRTRLFQKAPIDYSLRGITYFRLQGKVSFPRAVKIVGDVLKEWDPEFYDIFSAMVTQGRIDVYPKKGKRGGAFMSSLVYSAPSFILLNWGGTFNDVKTLIHETGHAIHTELSKKHQDSLNWDYPISLAEVASTFFEGLLLLGLIERQRNKRDQRALYEDYLQEAVNTVFRQIACYELEWNLHHLFREKGYLSEQDINRVFVQEMHSYLGKKVSLKGFERWWVYWSHIRYYFYVYSYAFGFLSSQAFINILKENPRFITKIKDFLSLGGSLSTEEAFAVIGLDVTQKSFWERGIKEIEDKLLKFQSLI